MININILVNDDDNNNRPNNNNDNKNNHYYDILPRKVATKISDPG